MWNYNWWLLRLRSKLPPCLWQNPPALRPGKLIASFLFQSHYTVKAFKRKGVQWRKVDQAALMKRLHHSWIKIRYDSLRLSIRSLCKTAKSLLEITPALLPQQCWLMVGTFNRAEKAESRMNHLHPCCLNAEAWKWFLNSRCVWY